VFGISSDNPDIPCPECRRILVEVRGFSRALSLDAGVDSSVGIENPMMMYGYGRRGEEVFFLFELFNSLLDGIFGFFHKQKARRLCRKLLREAPNSLICASCLFVYRRK
jgi:hypothetical protein